MTNILIDPAVVVIPPQNASRNDVEAWLENLDLWLTEALSAPFTWLYAEEATEALLNEGHYPEFLFSWQKRYHLDINIAQVIAKVGQFFNGEHEHDLAFCLGQLGYVLVAEPGSIVILPAHFASRWPELIRDYMHELLATTCACKHNDDSLGQKMHIATLVLENGTKEIEVSAVIADMLPESFPCPADSKIAQTFPLLFTPEELLPLYNVVECWDKGDKGIRYAIKQQYRRDWQSISPEPLHYEFGTRFIESVMNRKDMTDLMLSRITRTMGGVIADRPESLQYKPHWVREREESHTPQLIRARDKATAWRITITPDGAGWRMHYWRKVDSDGNVIIEFSNVLTKKDQVVIY
ncbi:MAG: hypothetical protein WCD86_24970 [Ktedonobacteraceae bacterium]